MSKHKKIRFIIHYVKPTAQKRDWSIKPTEMFIVSRAECMFLANVLEVKFKEIGNPHETIQICKLIMTIAIKCFSNNDKGYIYKDSYLAQIIDAPKFESDTENMPQLWFFFNIISLHWHHMSVISSQFAGW